MLIYNKYAGVLAYVRLQMEHSVMIVGTMANQNRKNNGECPTLFITALRRSSRV